MHPDEQSTPKSRYYKRDFNIIEYSLAPFHDIWVRTPVPNRFEPGTYGIVIGTEYSFSPYQQEPFHGILSRYLDFPILNLSIGGGIDHFDNPEFFEYINNAKFVIVQVAAVRNEPFTKTAKDFNFASILGQDDLAEWTVDSVIKRLFDANKIPELSAMMSEMRENWVKKNISFLNKIKAPKILFLFSKFKIPDATKIESSSDSLFNHFPKYVTRDMVEALKPHADAYIECISKQGLPNILLDRFTGQEVGKNSYYPSAEMNNLAAKKLVPPCCELLGKPLPLGFEPPSTEDMGEEDSKDKAPKSYYYKRDFKVIEYKMTRFDKQVFIRKPIPRSFLPGSYAVVLGSSYSFGPYQEEPYPVLLSKQINLPILNMSSGGNNVGWFDKPFILEYVNNAKFVIVQLVAARGESSSKFQNNDGYKKITLSETGKTTSIQSYFEQLISNKDNDSIINIVTEMRQNWLSNYHALLNKIKVPIIIFWFSQREPAYDLQTHRLERIFMGYPQLVDHTMVEELLPYAQFFVKCVSDDGLPNTLTDRFTGDFISKNRYYPSQEMHQAAANELFPSCTQLMTITQ